MVMTLTLWVTSSSGVEAIRETDLCEEESRIEREFMMVF